MFTYLCLARLRLASDSDPDGSVSDAGSERLVTSCWNGTAWNLELHESVPPDLGPPCKSDAHGGTEPDKYCVHLMSAKIPHIARVDICTTCLSNNTHIHITCSYYDDYHAVVFLLRASLPLCRISRIPVPCAFAWASSELSTSGPNYYDDYRTSSLPAARASLLCCCVICMLLMYL